MYVSYYLKNSLLASAHFLVYNFYNMAKKISNKILIGLTGEKPDDLLLKIREANGFGLKEASLFLELIEIAKRETPSGKFFAMHINEADKLEEKFDGIFMQAVLLHIHKKDAKKTIKKLLDKLKLGGYLYIAVKEKKSGGADEEIKTENDYGYPYERFFSYFTLDEIKNLMKELELEISYENISSFGHTRWIQVIGKK